MQGSFELDICEGRIHLYIEYDYDYVVDMSCNDQGGIIDYNVEIQLKNGKFVDVPDKLVKYVDYDYIEQLIHEHSENIF